MVGVLASGVAALPGFELTETASAKVCLSAGESASRWGTASGICDPVFTEDAFVGVNHCFGATDAQGRCTGVHIN